MLDLDHLRTWLGRTETATDVAAAAPLTGLAALLDHDRPPWPSGELVPLGHWLYFLPRARQSELAQDGHARVGGFLPPVPLPRRMWAGGRLSFHAPIPIGAALERRSTIAEVSAKSGKSGAMVFVTVRHEIAAAGRLAVREEQDIVYREMPAAGPGSAVPAAQAQAGTQELRPSESSRVVTPDAVQLFRYSALTFNAHRIHYDRSYCRDVEGYPGLVVHGPLIATLLLDHFLRHAPQTRVTAFNFRAQRPLYDTAPFSLCAAATPSGADLWTLDNGQQVTMSASVEVQR